MVVRNCWHCHAYANMSLPSLGESTLYETGTELTDCTFPKPDKIQEGDDNYFIVYQCDRCGYPNIAHYKRSRWNEDSDGPIMPMEWIPASAIGKEYPDVPERVASAASECHKCFSIGAYRSVVIMARSVLEAIITDKTLLREGSLSITSITGSGQIIRIKENPQCITAQSKTVRRGPLGDFMEYNNGL